MRVQSIDGTLAHYRGVMGQVHARQAQAMRPNEGPSEDDGEDDFLLSSVRAKVMAVNVEGLGRTKDDIVMDSVKDLFKVLLHFHRNPFDTLIRLRILKT